MLPKFFRRHPDIAVDLHLTDVQTDLIGDGFDAALRIPFWRTRRSSRD
jgi:DNA-binding transcriptional LysR family regulator